MYFIAVYPPQEIIEDIKVFKKDLATNYAKFQGFEK